MTQRELFRTEGLPVLRNRAFATAAEALASATGDVVPVQDLDNGLVFNTAFDPERIENGRSYQNEQACSGVFQDHLDTVTAIVAQSCNQYHYCEADHE